MEAYLAKINNLIKNYKIKGVRVCFEFAIWNSSDGLNKTYYHVHIQHDELPDLNIGIGDNDFQRLLVKIENQIIPELQQKLTLNPT